MRISEQTQENFPYMTVINYVDKEFVGIVINQDTQITSMYDYANIRTDEEKKHFLELGEAWWWESNRKLPINIFMPTEMLAYKNAIRNFATKDVKIVLGPVTSLHNIITKRIKRKSITLVRTPKK
jgi:hypothetical protein